MRANWLRGRAHLALVGGIVLVGFLLRTLSLQPFALTHWDEGAIWSGAQWFLSLGSAGDYMVRYSPPLPPALFALGGFVFGSGVRGAIWISVALGTASIVLIYWLAEALLSSAAGVAAALMLALSGLNVMYSRSLLTEPLYVFFLLCTLLASVRYVREPSTLMAVISGLSAACLQYTKYNGALAAGPLLAVLAFDAVKGGDAKTRRKSVIHLLLVASIVSAAVIVNLAALWMTGNLADFRRHYSHYVGQQSASPMAIARYVGLITPAVVLCFALAGLIYLSMRRRSAGSAIVQIAFLLYLAFLFGYTFYLRLLAPISIFVILYAAAAVHVMTESLPARWHVPVLAIASLLFVVSTWRSLPRYIQRDHNGYTQASAFLNTLPSSTRVILATQRYVWTDLQRPVIFIPGTSSAEIHSFAAGGMDAVLVVDIHAYYKYDPRVIPQFLDGLNENQKIRTIPNPLNLDCIENGLRFDELRRLDFDPTLKAGVRSIRVFKLNEVDVEQLARILSQHAGKI